MIVGVCGYGFTGSGAVLDLLKEYRSFEVLDKFEFSIIYKSDGIENLEHYLVNSPSRYFVCDTAIRRFINYCNRMKSDYNKKTRGKFYDLSKEYVSALTQITWEGNCSFHSVDCDWVTYYFKYKLVKKLRNIFEKRITVLNGPHYPDIKMYLSIQPNDFLINTKSFIRKLITCQMTVDDVIPVLDQPFCADNPEKSFKYFDDPYAIVVDKDPRDLYLLAKTTLGMRGRFIPSDNVRCFIEYYKKIMSYSDKNKNKATRTLYLHFEDLIYHTNETRKKIEQFLNIKTEADNGVFFFPEKSISNTQLFRKYPEFNDDIKIIEKELSEWLYDFEKTGVIPDFSTHPF